jgi:hypothetical protein
VLVFAGCFALAAGARQSPRADLRSANATNVQSVKAASLFPIRDREREGKTAEYDLIAKSAANLMLSRHPSASRDP